MTGLDPVHTWYPMRLGRLANWILKISDVNPLDKYDKLASVFCDRSCVDGTDEGSCDTIGASTDVSCDVTDKGSCDTIDVSTGASCDAKGSCDRSCDFIGKSTEVGPGGNDSAASSMLSTMAPSGAVDGPSSMQVLEKLADERS